MILINLVCCSVDVAVEGGLDLEQRAGDEAVDSLQRLRRQLRRPVTDLERHGQKGASGGGLGVGEDGEAGGQDRHEAVVAAVHHVVHGRGVHRRVHHRRAGGVAARLLQDQLLRCLDKNNKN